MSAPTVIASGTAGGVQNTTAIPLTGDLVWFMAVRGPAVGGGICEAQVLDAGGSDFSNLYYHDTFGLQAKLGSFGTQNLGNDATMRQVWVHYCFKRQGSSAGDTYGYALLDNFNPASPSFLFTPSKGNTSVPAGADRIYNLVGDNGTTQQLNGHAGHRGFATANYAAWTQAAIVEQFCHRYPIQYPIVLFNDFTDAANGGTDLSGSGNNDTWTVGTATDVTSPLEPALWRVTDAIRIGSMVARDSSASTVDHTVSA